MNNKGINAERCVANPMEAVFAREWEIANSPNQTGGDLLSKLLMPYSPSTEFKSPTHGSHCTIAATVIQWLGSNVGNCWLKSTLAKAEKETAIIALSKRMNAEIDAIVREVLNGSGNVAMTSTISRLTDLCKQMQALCVKGDE